MFAEVKVDEQLGVIRVTRVVSAVAAGRILNPKTAGSQILGGVVWGIGMALHEETLIDHRFGRIMNANIAEYHVPVHADVHDIKVIFVDEQDTSNPLGMKGVGEIGIVGVAAAIANAVLPRHGQARARPADHAGQAAGLNLGATCKSKPRITVVSVVQSSSLCPYAPVLPLRGSVRYPVPRGPDLFPKVGAFSLANWRYFGAAI